jgi:hypothetical protein
MVISARATVPKKKLVANAKKKLNYVKKWNFNPIKFHKSFGRTNWFDHQNAFFKRLAERYTLHSSVDLQAQIRVRPDSR